MASPDKLSYSIVQLVADPLVGGGNIFLVESEGDLLLVHAYECLCIDLNDPLRIERFPSMLSCIERFPM
ncbi:F-box protein [Trifolium medium]|uniref:F-box protein n=1 Tax=Trifolium medium TaxID=97028 RepID=A0A392NP22_9FABA|nr:F-box protein [Trifolium medium]